MHFLFMGRVHVMQQYKGPLDDSERGKSANKNVQRGRSSSDEPNTVHKVIEIELKEEEGGNQRECHICLSSYEDGEDICYPKNGCCQHIFHKNCISEWLLKHDDCPCCRRRFIGLLEKLEIGEGGKVQRDVPNE
uniref:RING-type domain-containing protein n=1 Tax=Pseudictyota dubia TaxID=2749911 RepID=A0A7R9WCW7_9STRA|mmetsp:Transcript_44853/g.83129  ORF Transcript_44853/g.83129 Transcript_44853/m.83129 type:complete len:134 (+) Transcript_44853:621-1022(+)